MSETKSMDLQSVASSLGKPTLYSFTKIRAYLKKKADQMKSKLSVASTKASTSGCPVRRPKPKKLKEKPLKPELAELEQEFKSKIDQMMVETAKQKPSGTLPFKIQ